MMGIGPSDARELTYWEYTAMLTEWNARHDPDGSGDPVEPPSEDFVRRRQQLLAERGLGKAVH